MKTINSSNEERLSFDELIDQYCRIKLLKKKYQMTDKKLTLPRLNKEIKPYIGTLVLMDFTIVRLIGAIQDNDDIYYETATLTNSVIKWSALMYFTPLKGFINDKRYENLVRMFNQNSLVDAI